ncbi:YczE/YyaS/YitT family protein [Bacillus sp. 1NLA3E]|jgi:uncharacterized membrane protein YczE|uniref:YczE/YyaS/YitT family protein n=1 Tax=Bacillus sp. 1NLA3E TaxID=666686 RepID=UPI000247EBE1|nr:YitT family protein [Bacillus sp. 1NLA3E]AGK55036.1 hypothetical protein B1NLA3E_16460 [Bacillus sp. 1NLA3E]
MGNKRKGQVIPRLFIFILGLALMSLGISLQIKASIGASPWDVLHIGLFYQFGLTIGTWSIIVGIFILITASLISKEFPQFGAFLNMVLIGLFIDLYLALPFFSTPDTTVGKIIMLLSAIIINGYGMGIYISAQFGAGPRDSLMIALTLKTGWKVKYVRAFMEVMVLFVGWLLGGPVFWGTVLFSISIGYIAGFALPQCQFFTNKTLDKFNKQLTTVSHS